MERVLTIRLNLAGSFTIKDLSLSKLHTYDIVFVFCATHVDDDLSVIVYFQPGFGVDMTHDTGDELFSDTYPMKLVDDCIYEVYGKVRHHNSWRNENL